MADTIFLSLIRLIQNPEEYEAQTVRVIGFANLEFEQKALYISIEDSIHSITKNAIWLDIDLNGKTKELNKKYVLIEGVFSMHDLGHLTLFSGTIKKINRIEEWADTSGNNK
jgi:hypothetical protein